MRKKLVPVFLFLTALSLACNFMTNLVPSDAESGEAPLPSSQEVNGFSAEATNENSVLLKWEPISGAEQYLIEVQIGDKFMPLATLPADQTSYQDDNVPPATRFTYRLSGLAGPEKKNSKEISIQTKDEGSDPLQVSLEFDMSAPALSFDPNNFDPNSIDLENFDPENFDPAMFAPQPIQAQAVIGPRGGEVSVAGSNGVVYTLNVPPDALRFEMTITLRPISAIPDLPLSGGLMAAVFVEPQSLVFDVPATLKMTPPADFPAAAGPLAMAFAFEAEGREFHLYPFDASAGQSNAGAHLASLRAAANFIPPWSDLAKLQNGGGYGQGSGTAKDVKEIRKKPASKSQNRTEQRLAVNQLDELEPLPESLVKEEANLGKEGEAILQKVEQADDLSKLMDALDDYSKYINEGGDKFESTRKLNEKILDLLVDKAKKLLDKNKGGCLTQNDFKAQELVERLTNPKSSFAEAFAERFKQKHGQKALDDLKNERVTCSFELTMDSKLTFTAEDSTLHSSANIPKLKLFPTYAKGEIYFTGEGKMTQDFKVTGICTFPLKHYDSLTFFVGKLTPIFGENGEMVDFHLSDFIVNGWNGDVNVAVSGDDNKSCPKMVQLTGGGDYWTGLFMAARFNNYKIITGWDVQTNWTADDRFQSLQADWVAVQPAFTPFGVQGSTSTENTKFELKVTKTSK
ncbi:MAG: hypothetical protein CVU44_17410 [Chloroflexi bacterium HGW-Chloroflexi-6]|nr:MAG: hypothetical protein CVU44_17410 [Chloroflexi bacterium HGW-Chloroflexi-6]